MRGRFRDQGGLFSYVSPASRVPSNHPLRQVRDLVRDVLKQLSRSLGRLYSSEGPSIGPAGAVAERPVAAGVLQHPLRASTDRATELQPAVPLVCRAVADDPVWDATTFTRNRERLQQGDVFQKFM